MSRRSSAHRATGRSSDRNAKKPTQPLTARDVAAETLRRVECDDAYANLLLPTLIDRAGLDHREAGLATELTYGTLRHQGLYDAIIELCAKRHIDAVDQPLRPLLRMGVHQLLAMRTADHAAVDQTVSLVRERVGQGATGFANAVLRACSRASRDEWVEQITAGMDPATTGALALSHSHPEWIVRGLRESLAASGRQVAELPELLARNNTAAPVTLALLPGLGDEVELQPDTAGLAPTSMRLPPGDPRAHEALTSGTARVQDDGSQLAALLAASVPISGRDEKWADACAGPGGKSAMLAACAVPRGATLTAFERQEHRAGLVRQALRAIPGNPVVKTFDSTELGGEYPEGFDRVLVDAPCTGLGALRRRPESRWRRTPADLARLTPLQRDLLAAAIDATRPGGVVAYVTCSPHPAETLLVVSDALRARRDVEALDAAELLAEHVASDIRDATGPALGRSADAPRAVQLWPHLHNTDAMFIALLRKK